MTEYSFTLNATFAADTQQEAWDMFVEWLTNPLNVEDGTEVVQFPPLTTVATCPRNHDPMALYATKMADPQGVAVYGEHFGCIQCDEDGWS